MPRSETISVEKGWTEATSGDVTAIRLQNQGPFDIHVKRGGAAEPADTSGSIVVRTGQIIPSDLTIAELFPGVSGSRVWIWSERAQGGISISHA